MMQDTNEQEIKPSKNGDFTRNVKDHLEKTLKGWRVIGESAGGTESKRLAAFSAAPAFLWTPNWG